MKCKAWNLGFYECNCRGLKWSVADLLGFRINLSPTAAIPSLTEVFHLRLSSLPPHSSHSLYCSVYLVYPNPHIFAPLTDRPTSTQCRQSSSRGNECAQAPALHLRAEGECVIQEVVSLHLPPSNKFSVSYAPSEGRQNSLFNSNKQDHMALSASDSEQLASEGESADERDHSLSRLEPKGGPQVSLNNNAPLRSSPVQERRPSIHMSRTLSMPLPSQLSQLQNPHRHGPSNYLQSTPVLHSNFAQSKQVLEVSVELADSIQLVIQTLLQISPPQVLDPAKEQFSACALSVPTSSMSALFTAMKNINYISANMLSFCESPISHPEQLESVAKEQEKAYLLHNEFDIGEMLQCVGDALSGVAAQAGVDLVIYHGDVGLKHVYVSGDESGISFLLSHIVRQVLDTAERGDSIELGLLVGPISNPALGQLDGESPPVDDLLSAAPLESSGPVRITIRVSHKYTPSDTHQGGDHPRDVVTTEIRPKPSFSTLLIRRILRQINGSLISDLPPPEAFTSGRTCDFEMVLERVPVPIPRHSPYDADDDGNIDPSLEQLTSFGETLKGKRVTLFASAKGSFAHHLTSYLTAWGMDVAHVSPDGQVDGIGEPEDVRISSYNQLLATYPEGTGPDSSKPERQRPPERPSFIFIDDNVDILKERLQALRFESHPYASPQNGKKRPSLSSNGRTRSTSNLARYLGVNNPVRAASPIVIVHFTSLSNYKVVRDVMQSLATSYAATGTPLPEVMIIPKPAGPRRFLTALHTAITKPTVDPLFMPIATSPMSPGIQRAPGSFFAPSSISEHSGNNPSTVNHGPSSQTQSPSSKSSTRPHSSRTSSDRSTRSTENTLSASQIPPSPLALPDNVEYFSSAAQKLGTSPSSGLVIQSPDGQTAGIYFHPRSKNTSRKPSTQSMERDRGQLSVPIPVRGPSPRISSGKKEDAVTFASLHTGAQSSQPLSATSPLSPSSPSTSPVRVTSVGPVEEQDERPSLASSILSPVPRRQSDDTMKLAPPPVTADGTSTSTRRNTKRSDAKDSATLPSLKKGKSSVMSDANIVPPISVLIVDDNPINQTILSTFMRRKKIKYDLASNGQEAVQKWHTGEFHLILMDIQMPVMDGIQATKEIRRLEKMNAAAGYPPLSPSTEGARTPSGSTSAASDTKSLNSPYRSSVIIVALTASSLQTDRVAALAAGCNDFLTKPVSLLWLNNKIIEWGSIKALQMWADIRPDVVSSVQSGQAEQARNVADRLHVPTKARATPPPVRRSTSILEDNAAALALASSAGPVPDMPPSPTASHFKIPEQSARTSSALVEPVPSNVLDTSSIFGATLRSITRMSIEVDEVADDGMAT